MREVVFDCEGDGLKPTKIHIFSWQEDNIINSTDDYNTIGKVLSNEDYYLIGHNIIRWDIPNLERLVSVKCKATLIDTLALSWYLEPNRNKHGLEYWGDDLGIAKPIIEDWHNLSKKEYQYRCESDVKITVKLWNYLKDRLIELYGNSDDAFKLIKYLMFKMHCAMLAEKSGWKLDIEKTKTNLSILQKIKKDKEDSLKEVMPRVPVVVKKNRPAKERKLDNSLTVAGEKWYNECRNQGLNPEDVHTIEVIKEYKEPNPNSHSQLKDWLFSLGWQPCTFKTNSKKEEVPQITKLDGPEVVPSIEKLFDKEPALESLNGLFVINHRISILKGFLENVDENGYVQAEIAGFTNTLRFKHSSPLVNLPGINTPYGEYIRPCLIAEEGSELCGSDMAGLEDRTKQNFIYEYDKDYVESMMSKDWDPHLDLAVLAGLITEDEVKFYKWYNGKK